MWQTNKLNTENHLQKPGYINCFDAWLPHKLSEMNSSKSYLNILILKKKTILLIEEYLKIIWNVSDLEINGSPLTIAKTSLHPTKLILWD